MTALRIFRTAQPSMIGARVLPMSDEDAQFWRLFAKRKPFHIKPGDKNRDRSNKA